MDCLLPGYSDDRAFVRMDLHQPYSTPTSPKLDGLLGVFFIVCSEGEVHDGVVCKQSVSDMLGVDCSRCHVVYVDQEEEEDNRP